MCLLQNQQETHLLKYPYKIDHTHIYGAVKIVNKLHFACMHCAVYTKTRDFNVKTEMVFITWFYVRITTCGKPAKLVATSRCVVAIVCACRYEKKALDLQDIQEWA